MSFLFVQKLTDLIQFRLLLIDRHILSPQKLVSFLNLFLSVATGHDAFLAHHQLKITLVNFLGVKMFLLVTLSNKNFFYALVCSHNF